MNHSKIRRLNYGRLIICSLFLAMYCFTIVPKAYAQNAYFDNLGRNLLRGAKNMISSPLDIWLGISSAHNENGCPVIRETRGFVEGTFNGPARFGSGVWDYVVMIIPGAQEGMPVRPETLF